MESVSSISTRLKNSLAGLGRKGFFLRKPITANDAKIALRKELVSVFDKETVEILDALYGK